MSALDLARSSAAARESHRKLLGSLQKNVHRTDDPPYLANGWHIDPGVIEAACKTVVGRRLKRSGMRWSERQTTPMCQLRALYRSAPSPWADYWNRPPHKTNLRN